MDIPSSSSSSSSSLPQPPHYRPNSYQNHNPTSSDLPATISVLQNLTILAESTLKSVYNFISTTPPPSSSPPNLTSCPFDSRHRMPPESLFRHSITCSSAPGSPISDLKFLDKLQYTKSFKSEDQLLKENLFPRPLPDADTCFSLDDELGEIYSNFFYKDCPGVVTTPEPDPAVRTFTLPAVLSTECANFMNVDDLAGGDSELKSAILPSDFWALRIEVGSWNDIPVSYSATALVVAVGLHNVDESSMKRWVILNSHRFGILIDAAMRDHIFLLLKLCLKAVRREAVCSLKLVFEKDECLVSKVVRFECPQLVSSITWLSFQISVLYGDMNGKLFVMGMVKESFLLVGRHLMLFTGKKGEIKSDAKVISIDSECNGRGCFLELDKSVENMEVKIRKPSECSSYDKVFVSQVASAIAALHERFLLERKVIALRSSQAMPRYQLINEYISTTMRASQERARRPNYRPLLEYDGLLWQRQNMQDFGKSKTREELLAEERDYKRRRMSYRGKKVKRNPMQVLHDIIEEHTEEIKQAGGIGCNVKIPSGSTLVSKFDCDTNKDFGLQQSNASNAHQTTMNNKSPLYTSNLAGSRPEFDSSNDLSNISSLQKSFHGYEDRDELSKSKQKTPRSKSPSYHTDYSRSNERNSRQNHPRSPSRAKHDRRDKDHDSRSTLTSKSQEARKYEYNRTPESRRTYDSRASERQRADSAGNDVFDDRYEPSRSYDTFYDGYCHSPRSQKSYKLPDDTEHRQRSYRHDSGRSEYHRKQ